MTIDLNTDDAMGKAQTRARWDESAAGCDKHTPEIRSWLRASTDAMMVMAGIKPGDCVLDVAAGAGDQTLDIAARVGPKGSVVASDISPAILAHALANAVDAGHQNVRTHCADAERLGLD